MPGHRLRRCATIGPTWNEYIACIVCAVVPANTTQCANVGLMLRQRLRRWPNIKQHYFNPSSPHDALKHHFTTLKTDLILLQLGNLD